MQTLGSGGLAARNVEAVQLVTTPVLDVAREAALVVQNELTDKRKRARQITALLKDEEARWRVVRGSSPPRNRFSTLTNTIDAAIAASTNRGTTLLEMHALARRGSDSR